MASPTLSPTAKRVVVIAAFVGALIVLYGVRSILPPFILALVVAYVLNPVVDVLMRVTRGSRSAAVVLLYLFLIVVLILTIVVVTPTLIRQIRAVNIDLDDITTRLRLLLENYQHIEIAGFSLDLLSLTGELRGAAQSIVSFLAARTGGLVFGVLSGLVWIVLILFVSFYLLKDAPAVHRFVRDVLPPAYQPDFMRLSAEINAVLSDYLRGQAALGLVVGVVTGVALAIIGVRNALLLGVLAGVLEVAPSIGPILAAIPAIAIAFFQGSATLPIENHWFALLVIGLYVIIQQVENNILVPRIVGGSVKLHPVVVMFGALAGATVAGILGVFLALPLLAVGRIVAVYIYQKVRQ
jgi:predicted PurR-regulated permease PerM